MVRTIKTLLLLSLTMGLWSCSDDDKITDNDPVAAKAPVVTESNVTENSVTLSWSKIDNVQGYLYSMQHNSANGQIIPIVAETKTTDVSVTINDLKPDTKYTFKIKALGDDKNVLDSEWTTYEVGTIAPEYLSGPWVEVDEITYQKHSYVSSYCYINVTFTPNDKTDHYYATVMNGTYFDTDPDDPDFVPNTEEDLISYLLNQSEVSNNKIREQNYWGRELIVASLGVDAAGNPGKLNWSRVQVPTRSEWLGSQGGDNTPSQANLRIQHVVINSAELEGAPANCFATVYRFEPVDGAKDFRFEDGFYVGDFAAKSTSEWTEYFTSIKNAYGESYDGYYSGWKSSMDLDSDADGLYFYDVTFWGESMAGESYELIYLGLDADAVPGTPGSYTVTLPSELPAISGTTDPAMVKACNKIVNKRAKLFKMY